MCLVENGFFSPAARHFFTDPILRQRNGGGGVALISDQKVLSCITSFPGKLDPLLADEFSREIFVKLCGNEMNV